MSVASWHGVPSSHCQSVGIKEICSPFMLNRRMDVALGGLYRSPTQCQAPGRHYSVWQEQFVSPARWLLLLGRKEEPWHLLKWEHKAGHAVVMTHHFIKPMRTYWDLPGVSPSSGIFRNKRQGPCLAIHSTNNSWTPATCHIPCEILELQRWSDTIFSLYKTFSLLGK
jgi:hypothetical protein